MLFAYFNTLSKTAVAVDRTLVGITALADVELFLIVDLQPVFGADEACLLFCSAVLSLSLPLLL